MLSLFLPLFLVFLFLQSPHKGAQMSITHYNVTYKKGKSVPIHHEQVLGDGLK